MRGTPPLGMPSSYDHRYRFGNSAARSFAYGSMGSTEECTHGYFPRRPQVHAVFPVQRKLQRTHRFLREISSRAHGLQARGARLIMDGQREQQLVGELRDFVRAESKDRSVIGVDRISAR